MKTEHEKRLLKAADKLLFDLSSVAPEDIAAQKMKVFEALLRITEPLRAIHEILDGKMWDPDDFDDIANVLRAVGFEIEEPR